MSDGPNLYEWIVKQRNNYKIKRTPDWIGKLKSNGFDFVGGNKEPTDDEKWNCQLEKKLLKFKIEHGHFDVPKSHDSKLNSWVSNQRYYYNGKSTCLTPDRIEKLEIIGFHLLDHNDALEKQSNIEEKDKTLTLSGDNLMQQRITDKAKEERIAKLKAKQRKETRYRKGIGREK